LAFKKKPDLRSGFFVWAPFTWPWAFETARQARIVRACHLFEDAQRADIAASAHRYA
jgi:hypothetical protein